MQPGLEEGDRPRQHMGCLEGPRTRSFQRGRCRRGRSETPHFSSKLQLFAPCCSRIKRKKSEEKREKRGNSRKKAKKSAKKAKKKGRFPPAPSTPTPLRTSQKVPSLVRLPSWPAGWHHAIIDSEETVPPSGPMAGQAPPLPLCACGCGPGLANQGRTPAE